MFLQEEMLAQALHKEYEERLQRQQAWRGDTVVPHKEALPDPLVHGYRQIINWLYTYALHWMQWLHSSQRPTGSAASNVR